MYGRAEGFTEEYAVWLGVWRGLGPSLGLTVCVICKKWLETFFKIRIVFAVISKYLTKSLQLVSSLILWIFVRIYTLPYRGRKLMVNDQLSHFVIFVFEQSARIMLNEHNLVNINTGFP